MIHPKLSDPILNVIENQNVEYRSTRNSDDDDGDSEESESDTDSEDESEESDDDDEWSEDDSSEDDSADRDLSGQLSETIISGEKNEDKIKLKKQQLVKKLLKAVPVENMKPWQEIVATAKKEELGMYADKREDLQNYGDKRAFHSVYKQLADQSGIDMQDEIRCGLEPGESRWQVHGIKYDFPDKTTTTIKKIKNLKGETNEVLCNAIRIYYKKKGKGQ